MGDSMKKIGKVLIIVVLLLLVCGGIVIYLNKDKNNVIGEIFQTIEEKENNDNKNGFYLYTDKLDKTYKLSNSCTLSSIKYVIAVVNDDYYLYKSNCLGVIQLKSGKSSELKIYYDSLKEYYYMRYDGNKYIKNKKIATIVPSNNFIDGNHTIYIDNYKKLIEELMINEYFNINTNVSGFSSIDFDYSFEDNIHQVELSTSGELDFNEDQEASNVQLDYVFSSNNIDDLPDFFILNSSIVISEKNKLNGQPTRNLKIFSKKSGIEYNLASVFPIKVNGVELRPDTHYIYSVYDRTSKAYAMLVSTNSNFCKEDSKESNIAFYEFKLEIDYTNYLFKTPTFVRAWYEKDGCSRVNELMEG